MNDNINGHETEDDKALKALFQEYNPEISDNSIFMQQLQENLKRVDLVRQHYHKERRYSGKALIAASVTGILVGFIFATIMPTVQGMTKVLPFIIQTATYTVSIDSLTIFSIISVAITIAASLAAYELFLFVCKRNTQHDIILHDSSFHSF